MVVAILAYGINLSVVSLGEVDTYWLMCWYRGLCGGFGGGSYLIFGWFLQPRLYV